MVERYDVNGHFSIGATAPTALDLQEIAQEGFASVVNLRTEQEDDQPLSPADEAEVVRRSGMQYLHFPVSSDSIDADLVDRFRERVRRLPGPVLVHCKSGARSSAFTMMHIASEARLGGDKALRKAKRMGFRSDSPELEQFVRSYVDQHGGSAR